MGALATCTVRRLNMMKSNEVDKLNGFAAGETEYAAHILFFENAKAYVVRDDNSSLYWINIDLLRNITPLT